jgi:hypothetical protein
MMAAADMMATKTTPVAAPNRSQFILYASIADFVLFVGVGQGSSKLKVQVPRVL